MASLRLCVINSVFKNTTRIKANNSTVTFCRTNHSLCHRRLITAINQDWPKLYSNPHKYWLVCRLEHGIPAANNVTPVVKNISEASESVLNSNDTKKVLENVSETGNINDSEKVTVNFDYSNLPEIPDSSIAVIEEASLKSLGLAGWSPSGIIQQILEFFHVSYNMPWWAAIVGLTFTLRLFMVPFTIKMKRDMINYSNNMPQYQHLQNKLAEARNSGSYYEVAQCGQELCQFLQEKKLFSIGMVVPYFVQMPLFISVFLALKGMSETPELKSFETGGILWFTDLSVPDQFYILPLLTAGTIWLTIRFGGNTEALKSSPFHVQRVIEIAAPVLIFIFTMHFPAATACYWTTTNIFVLAQNYILTTEPFRKYLNIPTQIRNVPPQLEVSKTKKGIVEGFKDSYKNMKLAKEIEDRERLNAIKFEQTSSAPVRRTFKFNPKEIPNLVKSNEKK